MAKPLKDLFKSARLTKQFEFASRNNRNRFHRRVMANETITNLRKYYYPTPDLSREFFERFKVYFEDLKNGKATLLDFYGERTIWDVYELFLAKAMDQELPSMAKLNLMSVADKIKKELPEDPTTYLKDVKNIYEPIKNEEKLDKILLAMLHHKLTHNGKVPLNYCYFVLRQCFYPGSAILKNRGKYQEVVYRFLEDYTKGVAIKNHYRMERSIIRALNEEIGKTEQNTGRTKTCINIIRDNLKELIRIGWVLDYRAVDLFAQLFNKNEIDPEDEAMLRELLSRTFCSDRYDNSPIVAIKNIKDSLGVTVDSVIYLDEDHVADLFEGTMDEKLEVINTILHENTHIKQYREFDNPQDYYRYLQLKNNILVDCNDIDYDDNYDENDMLEREAFVNGARGCIEFIKKNRLGLTNSIKDLEEEIRRNEAILLRHLVADLPMETDYGEKSLVSHFDMFLKQRMLDLRGGATVIGGNPFRNYPILNIEYDEDGNKRSFEEYLQNAKSLLGDGKILGRSEKSKLIINKKMIRLMKDIARYEYAKVEDIPEILFCLSRESIQYTGQDKDAYRYFIRDLTHEMLGDLFSKAVIDVKTMPRGQVDKIARTIASVEQLVADPDRAHRRGLNEFLSGIKMPLRAKKDDISVFKLYHREDNGSALDLMERFLDRAQQRTGFNYRELCQRKNGQNKDNSDADGR